MSNPSDTDIVWLAGLLEGEGCFHVYRGRTGRTYLRLYLKMTDEDVVRSAHAVISAIYPTKCGVHRTTDKRPNSSDCFQIQFNGYCAEYAMRAIRPYMHSRRAAKIDEILAMDLGHRTRVPSDQKNKVAA